MCVSMGIHISSMDQKNDPVTSAKQEGIAMQYPIGSCLNNVVVSRAPYSPPLSPERPMSGDSTVHVY